MADGEAVRPVAGKSATIEDTGFLQNYDGLQKETAF